MKISQNKLHLFFDPALLFIFLMSCAPKNDSTFPTAQLSVDVASIDRDRILAAADEYLQEEPVTVTAAACERSEGGIHDFYSEGDYWWPDPENPDGPYIRRDGLTNPDNFTDHRQAMRRMSIQVAALTAAFKISGEHKYADHAVKHLDAWFVDENTRMSPHMKFAQAIKGRVPGRGVGLIDGIHLVEPARAISFLEKKNQLTGQQIEAIKTWFTDFITFMTEHDYGIDERERENNHGTCWVMQLAEFSRLVGNKELMNYCRDCYKTVLLPKQMAEDGRFPMELERTKPYGYSLFNIDAMTMVVFILSTPEDNLWTFKLADGRGIKKGLQFIVPYIADKSTWPYEPDVMYWEEWPLRHPAVLFGGMAFGRQDYIEIWKRLPADPSTEEGWRNFPIRQPILWLEPLTY